MRTVCHSFADLRAEPVSRQGTLLNATLHNRSERIHSEIATSIGLRKDTLMLVLTRKLREKLVFPAINATVQVVAVKAGAVRLGIDAPLNVVVLRDELVGRSEPGGLSAEPITDCASGRRSTS